MHPALRHPFGIDPLRLGPHRDVTLVKSEEGVTTITISGSTPHFWSQPVAPPGNHSILSFEYFSTTGLSALSLRFRNAEGEMVFAGSEALPIAENLAALCHRTGSHPLR